jgi:hypothetical protein
VLGGEFVGRGCDAQAEFGEWLGYPGADEHLTATVGAGDCQQRR